MKYKLPDFMYSGLDSAIASSMFWTYPNTEDDIDMEKVFGDWYSQTPAAKALGYFIQDYLGDNDLKVIIAVLSIDPSSNPQANLPIENEDSRYPNTLVLGGEQSVSNSGRYVMYLHLAPVGEDFKSSDVSSDQISRSIGNIVRHEAIHIYQMEKRKKNQKISRILAKNRFEEEGEIPGPEAERSDYLGSKIEIDAYGHELAEIMLQKYGKEKSLEILRGNVDLSDVKISDQFDEYAEIASPEVLKRLKSKMYSHIINLPERGIYERKKVSGSQPEETYQKGNSKNLYLDKPSSHGGWPEGEYDPPVMTQIKKWLKKMKMIDEDKDHKKLNRTAIREMIIKEIALKVKEGMLSPGLGIQIPYGDHIDEEDAASQSDKRQDLEDELIATTAKINKDQAAGDQEQKKVDQDQLRGIQTSLSNFG